MKAYHRLIDIYTIMTRTASSALAKSGLSRRSDFYANGGQRVIDMVSIVDRGAAGNAAKWVTSLMEAESAWIDSGSPYYNIGGHYLEAASRSRLDIPCDMMRLPFPAMLVRIQEGHGKIQYGGELATILATEVTGGVLKVNATFVDADDDPKDGVPIVFSVDLRKGGSIEDAIKRSSRDCRHREFYGNMAESDAAEVDDAAKQCLKILVTVALLAVGKSDLLEPDVLARDRAQMQSASDKDKSRIVARAHRRGKKGWTVGETRLPRSISVARSSGGGRELTRSHLRCGHFHAIRHGRGRTEIKVMWFPPTAVRPDLPAVESRGYVASS